MYEAEGIDSGYVTVLMKNDTVLGVRYGDFLVPFETEQVGMEEASIVEEYEDGVSEILGMALGG